MMIIYSKIVYNCYLGGREAGRIPVGFTDTFPDISLNIGYLTCMRARLSDIRASGG
jgi:hypothetical protein